MGLLLVGLRINFSQRAPLAGFISPCVAVGIVRVQFVSCCTNDGRGVSVHSDDRAAGDRISR